MMKKRNYMNPRAGCRLAVAPGINRSPREVPMYEVQRKADGADEDDADERNGEERKQIAKAMTSNFSCE